MLHNAVWSVVEKCWEILKLKYSQDNVPTTRLNSYCKFLSVHVVDELFMDVIFKNVFHGIEPYLDDDFILRKYVKITVDILKSGKILKYKKAFYVFRNWRL